ncbi:hypothetical protein Tco_0749093 [Tanacetum coccineum]|uniref:Uncharacterized protein n=1 Tax=Tanacetum coccineum TaxID=301880 RepID=A0ABQ4Z079_9ASTR
MINQDIKQSKAYKTYLDYATGKVPPKKARKFKKAASPSKKSSHILEEEPAKKSKRVKRPVKKSTTASRAGVVIRDTSGVSVSKKKTSAKDDKGKGIKLLFDVALLEAAQLNKAIKKSKHGNIEDESDDVNDEDDNDDDSRNDDDGGNDAHDSERTDSDYDEMPPLTLKDDKEEDYEEEYVHTPENDEYDDDDEDNMDEDESKELYDYVNIRSTNSVHEEERKGDEEMTNANRDEGSLTWFKKLEKGLQPIDLNANNHRITVDSRPPQIDNLTQEILVGPAFNLLKGTCKSFAELDYHFKEYFKAINDQLDKNNLEGHEYPFDLSEPLPFIEAARYENIQGIEVMVPTLWSLVKVAFDRYAMRIITVTKVKVMKCYDYGHLEEIDVQRDVCDVSTKLWKGDFPRRQSVNDMKTCCFSLVQKNSRILRKQIVRAY